MSASVEGVLKAVGASLTAAGLEPVYLRRLTAIDGQEGVVVRPGTMRVATEYINGSCDVELPVRVIVKRRRASQAMAEAEDAADALDLRVLGVGGTEVTVAAAADRARELELSDSDWSVWEADVTASYRIEGKGLL